VRQVILFDVVIVEQQHPCKKTRIVKIQGNIVQRAQLLREHTGREIQIPIIRVFVINAGPGGKIRQPARVQSIHRQALLFTHLRLGNGIGSRGIYPRCR
tara:strand:- start:100592 stop:100888 length:297 start_codon:yes stop_codon:yes gene_type:complete